MSRILIIRGSKETRVANARHDDRAARPAQDVNPARRRPHRTVKRHESAPAKIEPPRARARSYTAPASPEPPQRPTAPSSIERDTAGYAKEVAKLNALDDPHAIPTIDPASRGSTMKSYAFNVPSSLRSEDQGNGIITPTRSGTTMDKTATTDATNLRIRTAPRRAEISCGRSASIPASDPFKLPPHPIPFPLPLPGWKLPSDEQMPPIEKSVYQQWAARKPALRQRRSSGVCAIPLSTNCTASAARMIPRIRLITWMPGLADHPQAAATSLACTSHVTSERDRVGCGDDEQIGCDRRARD